MGTYIYTAKAKTTNVFVDGEAFVPVISLTYAFKDTWREYSGYAKAQLTRAEKVWDALGNKPQLAIWENRLYVVKGPVFSDGRDEPGVLIGDIKKIGGRWHCVAQYNIASLVFNQLGYDYDAKTGEVTKQVEHVAAS